MAIYYVSKSGSDSNNGLGPDASHATNKPWLTIGKALGAAGIASGDTVYIGPGVYRETLVVAMTSAVAETKVYGDPTNAQGFKNSSGVLLAAAMVRWSAWTTDDKTTPGANILLSLAGRDFLTFQDLWMYGTSAGAAVISSSTVGASTNIVFTRCHLFGAVGSTSNRCVNITSTSAPANTALNWTFDSCIFFASGANAISLTAGSSASADYDLNFLVQNCLILAPNANAAIGLVKSGANSFLAGGIDIHNCTILSERSCLSITTGGSTSIPCTVRNSLLLTTGATAALLGVATGDIVEDYNIICAIAARTNVSAGANSQTGYAPLFNLGQAALWGFLPRFLFSPTGDSPIVGFGTDGAVSLSVDLLNRNRPSGPGVSLANALKAVGALEFHDFGTANAADAESGSCLELIGPGDHEFLVPVDASSTTITVKVKWDSNHGDGSKPQASLIARSEIGVAAETKTATGTAGSAYETLTFSAFTPTAKGWVILRLISRAAAGNGKAWFDSASVT